VAEISCNAAKRKRFILGELQKHSLQKEAVTILCCRYESSAVCEFGSLFVVYA
jgi:hypothetical protein